MRTSAKAILLYQACAAYLHDAINALSIESNRRDAIGRAVMSTFGGGAVSSGWIAPNTAAATEDVDYSFASYQIFPDASANLDPYLQKIAPSDLNQRFAITNGNGGKGGALWLGEHHNSAKDHKLQADFVQAIHKQRQKDLGGGKMSVGLEMIQVQFQPALDAYIRKEISAEEMKSRVEWDKRWSWSYEGYLPVFETCRELNIPLIALNVDSEDLGLVEEGGFPNLPRDKLQKYISDPAGFSQFATYPYYKTYVDYVISPSYEMHQRIGILRTTITGLQLEEDMPFSTFFSGRILWDEGMANNAYQWNKANPGGLMIGLVGADHVKFEGGITGRYQRMAKDKQLESISVILNPTLIDTRPSGSVSMVANENGKDNLTLQLRYLKQGVPVGSPESRESSNTGGVLALADYIVVSQSVTSPAPPAPKPALDERDKTIFSP
eukprot:CAMPEP_0183714406 /NCGR_PEP_ID=MMETSP0737-20130205/8922_1 /TAXON_ID=385413 /ORGANISM="Thalassiosira miniscula, Strain CCMP1093" /LENGTH=437 /DNA_ID=CAMNT_0025943325 /DNA_START=115 /DNA_END=1428 /DNA_ORIENTATION=+